MGVNQNNNKEKVIVSNSNFQNRGIFKYYIKKRIVGLEEEIDVEIVIENTGDLLLEKVRLEEILPEECEYIPDTLRINNKKAIFNEYLNFLNVGKIDLCQKINIVLKMRLIESLNVDLIRHRIILKYESNIQGSMCRGITESNEQSLATRIIRVEKFRKSFSKLEVAKGEKIVVEISGRNAGNVDLIDVLIINQEVENLELVRDTFKINGKCQDSRKFEKEILLEKIEAKKEFKIEYEAIVIEDIKKISEEEKNIPFQIKVEDSNRREHKVFYGQCDRLRILAPDLSYSIKKTTSEEIYLGGEILNKIILVNKGNIACKNIKIEEKLSANFEFIPNTLRINGARIHSKDIDNIEIDYLKIDEIKEITYITKAILVEQKRKNKVKIKYEYEVHNRKCIDEHSFYGKDILVKGGVLGNIEKNVDKKFVAVNDELNYFISFKNIGNINCEKVFIKEKEQDGLELIPNSVIINGQKTELNIFKGILYGKISKNEKLEIRFKCRVINVTSDSIGSLTEIFYGFKNKDYMESQKIEYEGEEIIVKSPIIDGEVGIFKKDSTKNIVMYEDEIPVRIFLKNTGNTDAYNTVVYDLNPKGIQIIEKNQEEYSNEENTFNLGVIKKNEEKEILYYVKIKEREKRNLELKAKVEYSFYEEEKGNIRKAIGRAKSLKLQVINPDILISENIDKSNVEIGEIINYTVYLTNNGNIELENLNFYIDNKIFENMKLLEVTLNKNKVEIDKELNIQIENLKVSESISINLKMQLISLTEKNILEIRPSINYMYDIEKQEKSKFTKRGKGTDVIVEINTLILKKETFKETYLKGERVNYLITIRNEGNSLLENVIFYDDFIEEGFIEDTLTINEKILQDNIIGGIFIGNVQIGETIFIRYSAIYDSSFKKNELSGTIRATCEIVNKRLGYLKKEFLGNYFKISLIEAKLKIMKLSNKKVLAYGESVELVTLIENSGDLDLKNIKFFEETPKGFELDNSNIFINGKKSLNVKSINGLNLMDIKSKEVIEVTTRYICKEYKISRILTTQSLVKYNYANENFVSKGEAESNIVEFINEITSFKNITINHDICLNDDEIWILEIIDAIVNVNITKSYVVKTLTGVSMGKERLTGQKVIIRGVLEEKIEYIADTVEETIHMILNREIFSTSIILPKNYDINDNVRIRPIVHKVIFRKVNDKKINIGINLTLQGLI